MDVQGSPVMASLFAGKSKQVQGRCGCAGKSRQCIVVRGEVQARQVKASQGGAWMRGEVKESPGGA